MTRPTTRALALLALAACTRPGEQRALAELDIGNAYLTTFALSYRGGP